MIWDLGKYGERIAALDSNGCSITYNKLYKISICIQNMVGSRNLFFIMCTNTIGSLASYVATLNQGNVPLMLSADLDMELLRNLLNLYNPGYIWLPESQKIYFDNFEELYSIYGYVLLKTNYKKKVKMFSELALLLTTSGSTGSPKLVRQSYRNIISNMEAIAQYLELNEEERPITTLPMNYTYGLSIIHSHLCVGATLLITDKTLLQKAFWDFFKQEKATSFGGVPYTYEILKKLRFFSMDLPSLKTMTQAGGKLSPNLHKEFAQYAIDTNKKFIVMYGQTEATARMAYLPFEKSLEKYGSMGIAIPYGKFSLIDTDGTEIDQPEKVGELVYTGDNVTLGYAECLEDLILEDERHGKLLTGDMAKKDQDGFYYIVGRKKRFLKLYGNRVNLDQLEQLIKMRYDNLEVACAGLDDRLYIFIQNDKLEQDIKHLVSELTKLNHAAFQVKTINQIPKNEAGKTIYKELEKYYD